MTVVELKRTVLVDCGRHRWVIVGSSSGHPRVFMGSSWADCRSRRNQPRQVYWHQILRTLQHRVIEAPRTSSKILKISRTNTVGGWSCSISNMVKQHQQPPTHTHGSYVKQRAVCSNRNSWRAVACLRVDD